MDYNHLKLIASALQTPDGIERIKTFIEANCSPQIVKIMDEVINSMEMEEDIVFERYASKIREEFTDIYLDEFNRDEITKEELDKKINNLHWTYLQVLDEGK
jgi:lipoate-protein ligase A